MHVIVFHLLLICGFFGLFFGLFGLHVLCVHMCMWFVHEPAAVQENIELPEVLVHGHHDYRVGPNGDC